MGLPDGSDFKRLGSQTEEINTKIPGSSMGVEWKSIEHEDNCISIHFVRVSLMLKKTTEYVQSAGVTCLHVDRSFISKSVLF